LVARRDRDILALPIVDVMEGAMRCFFLRKGHIVAVEMLPGLSNAEAVEKSHEMFEARKDEAQYEAFEVWELSRMVMRYPPAAAGGGQPRSTHLGTLGGPPCAHRSGRGGDQIRGNPVMVNALRTMRPGLLGRGGDRDPGESGLSIEASQPGARSMNDVANQQPTATNFRRPPETPTTGELHDDTRPPLTQNPPSVGEVTRIERIAFALGGFMTLFPLALAAWGAHHMS
jgi:hypothetical protein